jgi:hypothetical protein
MKAIYCLRTQPGQWNFCDFLVSVKTLGVKHINFINVDKIKTFKYQHLEEPKKIAVNRFKNIVLPLCDLAGVSYSLYKSYTRFFARGLRFGYMWEDVLKVYQSKGILWKSPLLRGKSDYVTITLRDSIRNKWRDSSPSWLDFIKTFDSKKLIILEDKEENAMSVYDRMKIYSGAKMNYSIANGPIALLIHSDAPYRIWIGSAAKDPGLYSQMKNAGLIKGSQFPFKRSNQELIWEMDTIESLLKHRSNI